MSIRTSHSVAKVSKKSGSNGRLGVSRCVYSSPGSSSVCSAGEKEMGAGELADDVAGCAV